MMKNETWSLPANVAKSAKLTGNEKVLYAHLLSNPGVTADPNTQAMADVCGVDKTTTLLSIKGLERARLIKVTRTKAKKLKRMIKIVVLKKVSAAGGKKKKKKKRK